MGIGKSRTPSINVNDMLEKAEISHEIETEKQDADKQLVEVREAKDALVKVHQDLQDAIKAERGHQWYLQCDCKSRTRHAVQGYDKAGTSCPTSTALKSSCQSMENRIGESPFRTGEDISGA